MDWREYGYPSQFHFWIARIRRGYFPVRFRLWLAQRLMRAALRLAGFGDIVTTQHACGNYCGYTEPYGFVPEAGCPVHDPDDHDYSLED